MSSFVQPALLWGLFLAAVPILIHLLARRRYRTVRWAAQEFLRAAFRRNQKRLRVENLLLLIARTALVILLVFALARPFVSGVVAGAIGSRPIHYAVLLDNSYSMGLNDGLSTPFERAVKEAKTIVSGLGREDSVTLYLTNDDFAGARPGTPRAILSDSHDAEKLSGVLSRLGSGHSSFGASRLAEALAVLADDLPQGGGDTQVVLLTDLTRVAWEGGPLAPGERESKTPAAAEGEGRTLRDLFEDISRKGAKVTVVDLGVKGAANAAVASLAPKEAHPLVERNQEDFLARVVNYGPAPLSLDVTFRADGETKGSVRVELPASAERGRPAEAVARFTYPPLEAGPRVFSAHLPADSLAADDVRYHAAKVRERIRVLAVDGDPQPDQGLSPETVYLKHAIAPRPDRIEIEVVDYIGFLVKDVENFDLVILANVERLREDKIRQLEAFVAGGGGLVVFLGDRVDPGLLNRDLWKDGDGLLPGQIAAQPLKLDREGSKVRFDLQNLPGHPLLDAIFGSAEDPEGFMKALAPRVWGYYPVTVPAGASVLVRLTDAEAHPLLVEKKYGTGRVLLFATAADLDWSDLPRVMIVPLLHEIVQYLARQDSGRLNLAPFEAFVREVPDRVMDVQVTTPGGGRERVAPVTAEGRKARVEFTDTGEPGPYRAVFRSAGAGSIDAGTKESSEVFAVDVDAVEGDLRRIGREELAARYPGTDLHLSEGFGGRAEATTHEGPRGEIWKPLLAAVLALLFIELLIARRFGDYKRRGRREEEAA